MTLPEAFQSQVQYLQSSPKFQPSATGAIAAVPFPGYSVITPPGQEDPKNTAFYESLQAFQAQVVDRLGAGVVIPVPADSFHLTLADLIWDSAYRHAAENPAFESQLRACVAQILEKFTPLVQHDRPIYWQAIGLFLRTRAIGVCLAPREEGAYNCVIQMRRTLYQNPDLIALGIEQQYNFTAHITLGYFGDALMQANRDRLSQTLVELSQSWLETNAGEELWVHQAELRKFDDMTAYYREADWPVLEL
jgi:hypothetical protein